MFFRSFRYTIFLGLFAFFSLFSSLMSCSDNNQIVSCKKNADCPPNYRCKASKCVEAAHCTPANASAVCRFNEKCVNGFCVKRSLPKPPPGCKTNVDCQDNKVCNRETGECVQCLSNDDCEFGFQCYNNQCTDEPPQEEPATSNDGGSSEGGQDCKSDADCKSDEKCDLFTHKCEPRTGQSCQKDIDCPGGLYCVNNACQLGHRSCKNDSDCQSDFECRNGLCYTKACRSDKDCEPTKYCDLKFGLCVDIDCTQKQCPKGYHCNSSTKKCEADSSSDCTVTGCPSGQHCNSSTKKCEPDSSSDCTVTGCQNGMICNPTTKQCESTNPNDCKTTGCPNGQKCNLTTGKCESAQNNTCTTDNDCTPPTGACQNGTCQSCASQFSCPSNKQCNISTGRCQDKPCTMDSECKAPTGTCKNGKCVSCTTITCPTGTKCNTSTGHCDPSNTKCFYHSQCAPGQKCDIPPLKFTGTCKPGMRTCFLNPYICGPSTAPDYCKSGICVPKQCGTGSGKTCPSGQICKKYVCTKASECGPNSGGKTCPADKYCNSSGSCIPKECGSGSGKTCPIGKICKNYKCTTVSYTRKSCTKNWLGQYKCSNSSYTCLKDAAGYHCYKPCSNPGGKCSNGYDCVQVTMGDGSKKSYCFFPPHKPVGAICKNLDSRCAPGAICLFNRLKDTYGKCYKKCTSSSDCSSSQVCSIATATASACLPKGSSNRTSCGFTSNRCDEKHYCVMSSSASSGSCVPRCSTPNSRSTCSSTKFCYSYFSSSSKLNVCLIPRAAGLTCGGIYHCKNGYVCVIVSSTTKHSICLKSCKTASDCSSGTGSSSYKYCRSLQSGGGVCYK